MALPALIDTAQAYLMADEETMVAAGVPAVTIRHIFRLRDSFCWWREHPSKRDRDVVTRLMSYGGISKSQAYDDLKVVKVLLGSFEKTTRDYNLYLASSGILDAIHKSNEKGDMKSVINGWAQFAKIHQLDKDEREELSYDIAPQPFKATDNPEVIGIKRMPNIRERIKAMKEKYWSEDVQDVDFEPIDFNEDELFKLKKEG